MLLQNPHMPFSLRLIESEIRKVSRAFPALILTGPRSSGKTTLLRHLFPKAAYFLFEDPDLVLRLRSDPRGFIESLKPPVIFDEIQNVPEIFNYVRTRIDEKPSRKGQWYLTGSQEAGLMRGVTESMAGRAAIFQLMPFSTEESKRVVPLRGGFPEALARPRTAAIWYKSYIQTYLERDVRQVTSIKNLATFRKFLSLLAARSGQILNKSDLASGLGVSVPTVTEWMSVLEITSQILIVPPFYENFGKRLVKSPKVYFVDSGLLCYLLGMNSEKVLMASPFWGAVFEGFVASEIVKAQINRGMARQIYFFRDEQGLEVDFLVPSEGGKIHLIEIKAAQTVFPNDAAGLLKLASKIKRGPHEQCVIYRGEKSAAITTALAPSVKALTLKQFLGNVFLPGLI